MPWIVKRIRYEKGEMILNLYSPASDVVQPIIPTVGCVAYFCAAPDNIMPEFRDPGLGNEVPIRGVVPREIWIEKRMEELARAIFEHCQNGAFGIIDRSGWVKELDEMLTQVNK